MGFNFTEMFEKIKNDPKYAEFIEKAKANAAEQKTKNNSKPITSLKSLKEMAEKARAYDILMEGEEKQ